MTFLVIINAIFQNDYSKWSDPFMRSQKLGHTDADVSSLCLGAMFLGTRNDQPSSYHLLDQYVDAGGSFIDTANLCPLGEWL
jgi:aryl-alcohol dehydrogenase-like predicted oxidoreductase